MLFKADVIIVGGGHAGVEAAAASARLGAHTLLITLRAGNLGEMSCNPAIGGIGKGTIVREVDAAGGIMGRAIDRSGIHYKMLNRSKGAAVWGPRAQADRALYKRAVQDIISEYPNISVLYESVEGLAVKNHEICGVYISGGQLINAGAVVLTTGTFLSGVIHRGAERIKAGRVGEDASYGLSNVLKEYDFMLGRLKTGTPPRIERKSIDFSVLEAQHGDKIPTPFSFVSSSVSVEQIPCYMARTNEKTHEIIRKNLSSSSMHLGAITGSGPRYCPSIEDKITRFADKQSHQIFLEPEGLSSNLVYPNGISNSLPAAVQEEMVRSIKGLERAQIAQPGYAIEYDYVDPRELTSTLQTKKIKNLFFAGQINGTTGYEEAAGQGLVAGANAALSRCSKEPFILGRSNSYIGVMIDDLTLQGVSEPYRMFTSRSEYRILLRSDNADIRLTEIADKIGLIDAERREKFYKKLGDIKRSKEFCDSKKFSTSALLKSGIQISQTGGYKTLFELLGNPNCTSDNLHKLESELKEKINSDILEYLTTESKYSAYINRQNDDIKMFLKEEEREIPARLDYRAIGGLSAEISQKLQISNPATIGAAKRIEGMTPAALTCVIIHLKKLEQNSKIA